MTVHELNKKRIPLVKINKSLDQFDNKILFPEKVKQANEVLSKAKLPGRDENNFRSKIFFSYCNAVQQRFQNKAGSQDLSRSFLTSMLVLKCLENNNNKTFDYISRRCEFNRGITRNYLEILNNSGCVRTKRFGHKTLYSTTNDWYVAQFYVLALAMIKKYDHLEDIPEVEQEELSTK